MRASFDVLVKMLLLLMLLVEVHFWVLFIHSAAIATHQSGNRSLFPKVVIRMLSVETYASKGSVGGLSCQFDKVAAGELSGGERVDERVRGLGVGRVVVGGEECPGRGYFMVGH